MIEKLWDPQVEKWYVLLRLKFSIVTSGKKQYIKSNGSVDIYTIFIFIVLVKCIDYL